LIKKKEKKIQNGLFCLEHPIYLRHLSFIEEQEHILNKFKDDLDQLGEIGKESN